MPYLKKVVPLSLYKENLKYLEELEMIFNTIFMSKLYYLFFADLSGCQLIQVPDAIYFMMKDTQLTACNLSSNVITKIPPKFPNNFNFITELNLSHNRMSTLPEEISKCTQLETVDISNNSFVNLPNCLFNLPKIIKIIARKNFIAGVYTLYYKKTSINYFRKKKNSLYFYFSSNFRS